MQPITYVYTTATPEYAKQTAKALGISQLIFGILMVVLQIASIVEHTFMMSIGHGIWNGTIVIIAGSFGIASSKHNTSCLIVTFMVMSIIAATFSTISMSISAASISFDLDEDLWASSVDNTNMKVMLDVWMLIVSVLEIVAAIWSSGICCKVMCCAPPPAATVTPGQVQVHYIAAQPGVQPSHPVNIVIAGPSGAMGQQPQQAFMYAAPQGPSAGYLPASGEPYEGVDSPPPAYTTAPPLDNKAIPMTQ